MLLRSGTFARLSIREFCAQLNIVPASECCPDDFNVSLASLDVFRRLSLISGCLVKLTVNDRSVYTRLHLNLASKADAGDNQQEQYRTNELHDVQIDINSITSVNLGLNWISDEAEPIHVGQLSTIGAHSLPAAKSVTLVVWGIPCPGPSLRFASSKLDAEQNETFPLPTVDTLLQVGHLVAVVSQGNKNCNETYFYHVESVKSENAPSSTHSCFRSTRDTFFRIVQSTGHLCPRLPPLTDFIHCPDPVAPHPDVPQLIRLLAPLSQSAAVALPTECVLHLHGMADDAATVTRVAANRLGRRLVTVPGLAFAAHYFHAMKQRPLTGSLNDKLAGLQSVLEQAACHAPSLLLLSDVDRETFHQDRPTQLDAEQRLWSQIMDFVEPLMRRSGNPPVVVILSSENELSVGPLKQNLVFNSLKLSKPDRRYIEYLCNQHLRDSSLFAARENLHDKLLGRTSEQIVQLLHRLSIEKSGSSDGESSSAFDSNSTLENLCSEMDRRAKAGRAKIPQVHWSDVGGLAHVRQEIMDAIELPLSHPHLFSSSSSSRSGILLYGPPGTGKTLVAKAVATECGLPFLSVKGPELLGSYIGESEANVRKIFAQAREWAAQNTPPACILFLDELDSLAPRRGDAGGGQHVMDRVVATFLGQLDLDNNTAADDGQVFVLGATNRPDLLDSALIRPGRLDRLVYLGIVPEDRARILSTQMAHLTFADSTTTIETMAETVVATLSDHVTGADLSTIVSGAQRMATERLCHEADAELLVLHQQQLQYGSNGDRPILTIQDVLSSWSPRRLTPRVELEDLLEAARQLVPSVSLSELQRYEKLRQQFAR